MKLRVLMVAGVLGGMLLTSGCKTTAAKLDERLKKVEEQVVDLNVQLQTVKTDMDTRNASAAMPPAGGALTMDSTPPAPIGPTISDSGSSYRAPKHTPSYNSGSSNGSSKNVVRVGVSVSSVQSALKGAGVYRGAVDGKAGPQTVSAIKEFQRKNGLKADGVVGAATWSKLKKFN